MSIPQIAGIPPPTSSRPDGTSVGPVQRAPASVKDAGVSVIQTGGSAAGINGGIQVTVAGSANASGAVPNQVRQDDRPAESQRESIERAKEIIESQVRDLAFSIDDRTGEVVIKVVDRESQEVIRQIPSEEMLRIAERLEELSGQSEPGMLLRGEV